MTTVEKFVDQLRRSGETVPDGWRFRRTYAGRVQSEAGAWSWWIEDVSGRELFAGYVSVTELLKGFVVNVDGTWPSAARIVDPAEVR